VARLDTTERAKGIDQVLAALPAVVSRIPDVSYSVIGGGSDLPRLQGLARKLGIENHVRFLGIVDDQLLIDAYHACDIFVLPSAKEGFGLVFLEAMAAGKPVVAAGAGATGEVVIHNETGLLIDYGDVGALAQALTSLLIDDISRKRMGRAGQERAEKTFSFDRYVNRLSCLVAELAGRPGCCANADCPTKLLPGLAPEADAR
jgi:glycosyltransferase involved in cell wall biosynthesis